MTQPNNAGKVLTRQLTGGTALTLNLRQTEASALRSFVDSIRLRGDKIPSMTLIGRRAMLAYLSHVQFSQSNRAAEIEVLEKMATPFTDRKNIYAINAL